MIKRRKIFVILFLLLFGANAKVVFSPQEAKADTPKERPTIIRVVMICGDGFKSLDETCDKGNLLAIPPKNPDFGTSTCSDFEWAPGQYYNRGYLICSEDCSAILTSMCSYCSNSIKEGYEECDADDFGGATCQTYGYKEGTLSCTASCLLNLEDCSSPNVDLGGYSGGGAGRGGGGSGQPEGYKPGSDVDQGTTKITISGKAFPSSDVHILVEGKLIGIVKADGNANFSFETKDITPGVTSFSFWAEDYQKVKSTIVTLTFRVISGAITNITGAYISPTISADKTSVSKNGAITFNGQTVPSSDIFLHVNSDDEIIKTASSSPAGDWRLIFDTSPLKQGEQHTAKALFQTKLSDNNIVRSGFSKSISFTVGEQTQTSKCANADLNSDKRVNLTDFSILLFYWGTNNACADQNNNGKVDLTDFSIMMYHWTG